MKKIYTTIVLSFFTMFFYSQCSHQLNMYDSFGDGNGNAVDVTVNGSVVVSGATIATGSYNFANFNASSGDAIGLTNWITGSWTNEVSWDITDGDGVNISDFTWNNWWSNWILPHMSIASFTISICRKHDSK